MKYSVLWIIKTNSSQGVQIRGLNSALMNNLMFQFMKGRASKTCTIQLQVGRLFKRLEHFIYGPVYSQYLSQKDGSKVGALIQLNFQWKIFVCSVNLCLLPKSTRGEKYLNSRCNWLLHVT